MAINLVKIAHGRCRPQGPASTISALGGAMILATGAGEALAAARRPGDEVGAEAGGGA
jgi:hypothetical protein